MFGVIFSSSSYQFRDPFRQSDAAIPLFCLIIFSPIFFTGARDVFLTAKSRADLEA